MLLNQPDAWVKDEDPKRFEDYNCFYITYPVEKRIRELAARFASSYHVAIFSGNREPEFINYDYFSQVATRQFSDSVANILISTEASA